VPLVCLAAGLLLSATHAVAGGDEIRRSDAPRLVDLVRETQESVDRLTAERDALANQRDNRHGASPGAGSALTAITERSARLADPAGLDPLRGPGLVVTLTDAQRDAEGRFPRDATPDDLVVHQQDIEAVLNALWAGGAEGIQMQDQRLIAASAARRAGATLAPPLGAWLRRPHAAAQRPHLRPAACHHRGRRRAADAGRAGRRAAGAAVQAVRGPVRPGLHRGTARRGGDRRLSGAGADAVRHPGRSHRLLISACPRALSERQHAEIARR